MAIRLRLPEVRVARKRARIDFRPIPGRSRERLFWHRDSINLRVGLRHPAAPAETFPVRGRYRPYRFAL
jgi:hypothetical protein